MLRHVAAWLSEYYSGFNVFQYLTLRGILAAGVAPYVQTAAGVLMPVAKVISAPLTFKGVPLIFDELGAYDGIDRATNIWWRNDTILCGEEVHRLMREIWEKGTDGGPHLVRLVK